MTQPRQLSSSRQQILARLRSQPLDVPPLPDVIHGEWLRFTDPVASLAECLRSVGGACEAVPNLAAVRERLLAFPEMQQAESILSTVPGIGGNVDLNSIASPRDLRALDFVIVPGQMAVAENGAVWVDDAAIRHRAIYFITQHLVLIVKRAAVVHNMHEAYSRLEATPKQFGCFISGPSKTADIEQSLVIGAHGCCSMQLYIVDSW